MEEETKLAQGKNIPEKSKEKKPDKETLLVEYQKAQDSAEHHDNLLWISVGAFTAATSAIYTHIEGIVFVVWIVALSIELIAIWNFRYYKDRAYFRYKEIERNFGMKHHLLTDKNYEEKGKIEKPMRPP